MEIVNLPITDKEQLSVLEQHNFQNIIFSCESSKILSDIRKSDAELYKAIMNPNNLIRITGGKFGSFTRFIRTNRTFNYDENTPTAAYSYKFGKTIYQVDDVEKILDIYEKIETGMEDSWSDMQKVMYVYGALQEYITSYNQKGGKYRLNSNGTMNSNNDSLLALVDNTGICDSISSVFHEAMQRIGIESHYIEAKDHAWNIICPRDEKNLKKFINLAVDLTWDVCANEKYGKKSFKYFGFKPQFEGVSPCHIPKFVDDVLLFKSCNELTSDFKKEVFNSTKEISQENS